MAADDDATHQKLAAWVEQHGGYVCEGLSLSATCPDSGRGVQARQAIKEGDQLLLVPLHMCLHWPTAAEWEASQVSALLVIVCFAQHRPIAGE